MSKKYFDIVVAKEFEVKKEDGTVEPQTRWNKVGQAWSTKNPGSFNFELFLMPGVRYLMCLREKEDRQQESVPDFNDFAPF